MLCEGGNGAHQYGAEVDDVVVHRVEFQDGGRGLVPLYHLERVEERGQIHPQGQDDGVDVLNVAEPDVDRREDKGNACREEHQHRQEGHDGQQQREVESDARFVQEKEHHDEEREHREKEIHDRGQYVGDREDLVHETGLGQEVVVVDHTGESVGGRVPHQSEDDVTREDIDGIKQPVHLIAIEDHGEDQRDHDHIQQRIQDGPNDAQHRIAILVADVPVHDRDQGVYRTAKLFLAARFLVILFLHYYLLCISACHGSRRRITESIA